MGPDDIAENRTEQKGKNITLVRISFELVYDELTSVRSHL